MFGQVGWILASLFFATLKSQKRTEPRSSHLDLTLGSITLMYRGMNDKGTKKKILLMQLKVLLETPISYLNSKFHVELIDLNTLQFIEIDR